MSEQKTTVAELREKNEIVINKHIAALNSVGSALQQFLDVLTANAVLTSEKEALAAENAALKAQLAALAPKAVEAAVEA
jgi:hypothetical protein